MSIVVEHTSPPFISPAEFLADLPTGESPLAFALYYASRGLSVFPIYEPLEDGSCSCEDPECADIGKHPRVDRGFYAATTDHALIRKSWMTWPDANIGVATGAVSGVVVLDVDPKRGGSETFAKLVEDLGGIPMDAVVATGGDGTHLYLAHPGVRVPNRNDRLPGLDVRGDGGYVVAPPSLHKSGKRYQWEVRS